MKLKLKFAALWFLALPVFAEPLVYEGSHGPGKGKHIVFIANDHEYRSEQTCPLMAKIMAKHFGFKCTVLFGIDGKGHIKAGANNLPGLEALQEADLLFFFTRFMNLPDAQVKHLVDYFERGGPVVGLRTSTHCFNGQKGIWGKLNYNYSGDDYKGGLGQQIFGHTWKKITGQSHYGSNHIMGSRITPVEGTKNHPILSGVEQIHAYSGAYASPLPSDAISILEVQVLNTFHPGDDIHPEKPPVTAGWILHSYKAPSGKRKNARVVYTSYGASEDLQGEDGRRFLVNACLWAGGWESSIRPDLPVSIVGKFQPSPYTSGLYYGGVDPKDLSGFESKIMPDGSELVGLDNPKFLNRVNRILANRPRIREQLKNKIEN